MKRILLIYIFLVTLTQASIHAQVSQSRVIDQMGSSDRLSSRTNGRQGTGEQKDSTRVNTSSIDPSLYMWHVDERLGNIQTIPADTAYYHFQNLNLVEGVTGHNNYLGNLGSPSMSRIYFDRPDYSHNLFIDPYSSFYVLPQNFNFANSRLPYTNLTYYKAGSKVDGEEHFKSYFSVNVNKKLAFGFNIDYQYGRGFYTDQSTSHFNGALFGSYLGERYQAHLLYNSFSLKMIENGGIEDDRYITDPLSMSEGKKKYEPANIPVNFTDTWNKSRTAYLFLTHRYNLGFKREKVKEVKDLDKENKPKKGNGKGSGKGNVPKQGNGNGTKNGAEQEKEPEKIMEFVPVTSFIHTMKVERAARRYLSLSEKEDFYKDTYINKNSLSSNDTTRNLSVKNTFGIALLEGFNKYAQAGLTGFISHELRQYNLMNKDSISTDKYTENEVYVGGELSRKNGKLLHYSAIGEVGMLKESIGQFRLKGNLDLNFRLFKDTVTLVARGNISNTLPSFYMRHYHSNHFYWDNDNLSKEFKTRLEGELSIKRLGTNIKVAVENVKNYTYFNSEAIPQQHSGSIQILGATLSQNLKAGNLHLDNEVSYQKSGNNSIIPLPDLSLYHNLYLETKLSKKVLSLQLGADVRYFSKYYAPAYTPAIGNYNLQDETSATAVKIGGYPIVNLYANLHLKRTRFFVMFYHVNQGSGGANSFYVPHYPINPRMFKFGLSWNFYD